MARDLPPHIWFVRSNRGSGSYPVTAEGRRALWIFGACVAASAVVGGLLAAWGFEWLWVVIFVGGTAGSAIWFMLTARRHTDYSISYNDYLKDKKNA
jgi:hypothetical protein